MKKVIFIITVVATVALMSCTAQSPKATFRTGIDSLSYAIGMNRVDGLHDYLFQQGIDSTYLADFLRGFNESTKKTSKKDAAYFLGIQVGQVAVNNWTLNINQQLFAGDPVRAINNNNMFAGFNAAVINDESKMSRIFALAYEQTTTANIREETLLAKHGENKAAGEKFLSENKDKEGVRITESGLQYKIIKEGKGKIPTADSRVKVHYRGTLIDGVEFDSSFKRDEPSTFLANGVIKGWTEALTLMPVGSRWELYIPYELGYSTQDKGTIKPFSTLIFEVELLEIVD